MIYGVGNHFLSMANLLNVIHMGKHPAARLPAGVENLCTIANAMGV